MAKSEEQKAADALSKYVGHIAFDSAVFAIAVTNILTRRVQQRICRAFISCITLWAEQYDIGYFDADNSDTVVFAKRVVEAFDKTYGWPPRF